MTPKSISLRLRPYLDRNWKHTGETEIHKALVAYSNLQLARAAELIESGASGWVTENRFQIAEQIRALRTPE